jgi:LmbE family N-acetylglucosaminyl deacetylase
MPRADPSPREDPGLHRFGWKWTSPATVLRGRVCVLAPHLDDAAFSIGATLAAASYAGCDVRVITVFAGDPASTLAASWWDERAGFGSLGAAAEARRHEDAQACRLLGATPVWLPFADDSYGLETGDEEIWAMVLPKLDGADLVLAPGFPLMHDDHVRICRLARANLARERVAYYVEQPYAAWLRKGLSSRRPAYDEIERLDASWTRSRGAPKGWAAKSRAMRAYRSQLPLLKKPIAHVVRYELLRGGETIALPK